MKTRKILLVLTILFCIFGLAKVNAATEIEKVDIEVPVPVFEKQPADTTQVTVKANDSLTFETLEVTWYIKHNDGTGKPYEIWNNTNEGFSFGTYAVMVTYKRPNEYQNSQTIKVNVNGNSIDTSNFEEFQSGGAGDLEHEYDVVFYEFGYGYPQVQKNLSRIEITVPEPTIGNTLAKASDVNVKADDSEEFEVISIRWLKYNTESDKYEDVTDTSAIVEANEKYEAVINYIRPSKYGISSATKITVNGNSIDTSKFEEFNPGSWGDLYNEYDAVVAKFEAKVQDKIENENNVENAVTEDTSNKQNTINNPKTGDNIVVYSVVLVVAILGIGLSFKMKK